VAEEMSTYYCPVNFNVKMQLLVKKSAVFLHSEMCGGNCIVMKMGCDCAIEMGGWVLYICEQFRRSVVNVALTLLQLSYGSACSNNTGNTFTDVILCSL